MTSDYSKKKTIDKIKLKYIEECYCLRVKIFGANNPADLGIGNNFRI